jgi:asparagine synthase (glutamine-hydrolysing)
MCRAAGLDANAVERLWKAFEKEAPGLYWSRVWSIFVLLDWLARHRVSI